SPVWILGLKPTFAENEVAPALRPGQLHFQQKWALAQVSRQGTNKLPRPLGRGNFILIKAGFSPITKTTVRSARPVLFIWKI
ncbi:MAG TPA: hypothetical protein VE467_06180, partial [Chryseolinea sp.]|nr:hypothetical protein [Chryseolinea sp.]